MFKEMLGKIIPSVRAKYQIMDYIDKSNELMTKKLYDRIAKRLDDLDRKLEYMFFYNHMFENECSIETKKRIFLSLPSAEGQLRELQLAENYILQRLKDVCDENGIQFFLISGTLIGAIRHHGFIPWDDDIDVGMMESDCERIKKVLEKDPLIKMNRYYQMDGSMLYKVKYQFSEAVFIDVFPYELINCDEKDVGLCRRETERQSMEYRNEIRLLSYKYVNKEVFKKRPFAISELDQEADVLYEQYKKRYKYWSNGAFFSRSMKTGGCRKIYSVLFAKEEFPLLKNAMEFEGKKYDALIGYMDLLEKEYGDIWTLPSQITAPHSQEFEGVEDCLCVLKQRGIL